MSSSSSADALPADVQELLKQTPQLEKLPNGRIRCNLTGHEMPARAEVIQKHMDGPKFRRRLKIQKIMNVHGEIFEDIGYVYLCKVTGRQVAKDPEDIERHLEGKLFKKAIASAEKELEKEPNIVDDMEHGGESGTSDEDEDEEEEEGSGEDEEYPEFLEAGGDGGPEDDSYDFAVMDTEIDTSSTARKRKADATTGSKKKRQK